MQKCLLPQLSRNIHVYVDDIMVKTKQHLTLLDDLKETFANLRKYKIPCLLTVSPDGESSRPPFQIHRPRHLPPAELAAIHGLPHALLLSPLPSLTTQPNQPAHHAPFLILSPSPIPHPPTSHRPPLPQSSSPRLPALAFVTNAPPSSRFSPDDLDTFVASLLQPTLNLVVSPNPSSAPQLLVVLISPAFLALLPSPRPHLHASLLLPELPLQQSRAPIRIYLYPLSSSRSGGGGGQIRALITRARHHGTRQQGRRQALDLAVTSSALARLMGIGWSMHAANGGSPRLSSSPARTMHPTTSSIANHEDRARAAVQVSYTRRPLWSPLEGLELGGSLADDGGLDGGYFCSRMIT
ncbi:uncharacterized protein LOC125506774 [Triticum urartu]|uniref:uncharacterized protein LOC125506774 n=1 Tax=Triticum urartu TaxID=4572 RepID=UPI002043E766|nr:uncharacterized protein LOC125506774 [Triticum urartu]